MFTDHFTQHYEEYNIIIETSSGRLESKPDACQDKRAIYRTLFFYSPSWYPSTIYYIIIHNYEAILCSIYIYIYIYYATFNTISDIYLIDMLCLLFRVRIDFKCSSRIHYYY